MTVELLILCLYIWTGCIGRFILCVYIPCGFICVFGSVFGLFSCVVWSLLDMLRGWLDSFSSVASLYGVLPVSSCLEHVRAGGGVV